MNEIYGKLMLQILGSLNEFEVNVLGERIKDVKQLRNQIKKFIVETYYMGCIKRR